MKHIKLDSLTAQNFKGLSETTINFVKSTNIYGANATGKTSLLDAFMWLMFGKDSQGRSDFQTRPVDEDGAMVDGIEISVEAGLTISDDETEEAEDLTIKKTQKQNWVKKRGSDAPTFQGNTNSYEINGYPATQKEFDAKIASIIDESLFRLLTNPKTFAAMKWQEQREILLRFVSEITDADVLATDEAKYLPIKEAVLAAGAEKAKEKAAITLRKLKEEQKAFPVRIDEAMKSVVQGLDADDVGARKADLDEQLKAVLNERDSLNEAMKSVSDIQAEMMKVRVSMAEMESAETAKLLAARRIKQKAYDDAASECRGIADDCNRKIIRADALKANIEADEKAIREAMAEWKAAKTRTMAEDETVCPNCGRPYEPDRIDEIKAEFEKRKKADMDKITVRGKALRAEVDEAKAKLETLETEVAELKERYRSQMAHAEDLKDELADMPVAVNMHGVPAWQEADRELHELQVKLSSMGDEEARKRELAEREAAIRAAMKAVEADVARLETNARAEARVEELREGLSECAQKVADQEQVLYLVDELIKAKMDMLSDLINSKFSHVRFRLFDRQINGAVKETCVMQIASNGSYVDYQNANNAAQIQGGLDVIEALSRLYSVNAPIWIDNRESVTDIPDMDAQIINLIVSPEDKALRVEWK